jgi:hypothetical protein
MAGKLCDAHLVIKVDEYSRPASIVVMLGQAMLAQVKIAEVRRVLSQLDDMLRSNQIAEGTSERSGAEEEARNE